MFHRSAGTLLLAGALLCPPPLHAERSLGAEAALFDRPLAVKTVPPKSANDETGELICTYYRDVMVRETGTDSPAPGPAAIIPVPDAARRPACNAAHAAQEIPLKTEQYYLLGRKGPFLFFDEADPNGAERFMILDASTGRTLYADGRTFEGVKSVALEAGALHIRFIRAFNGSCSVSQDAPGCWPKLVQEGKIPAQLAQSAPPVHACTASYAREKAPADDPSVISYGIDMTVDRAGDTKIHSFGSLGCEPMP